MLVCWQRQFKTDLARDGHRTAVFGPGGNLKSSPAVVRVIQTDGSGLLPP